MNYQHNFSLKSYNTFGIEASAQSFIEVTNEQELAKVLKENQNIFVLGGGSNMLLTQNINQLVVHVNLKGIEIVQEDADFVWVKGNAGENWHEFVQWCITKDFGGIENLSLIPGNVGTTPIQNIGAYGVEIKDTMFSCEAMEIATQKMRIFTNAECEFAYRESIFKNELKGQFIITSVIYKLTKKNHNLNTSYGAIDAELVKMNVEKPTIKTISEAVIAIRSSKLPNPKDLGNSGSFFKNPIISKAQYDKAVERFPEMPHYKVSDNEVKVPAGWLIEQAGFKGKRFGDAGIHKNQALVLVNYGGATGKEIYDLSKLIQKTVLEQFGVAIEAEVNII
ncbi:UDP-N-acetylmuramate dehydrogenase [Flavobacterium haoranii]|uniref:UDP-N-acetylenolpyruvoylglucosamine reductase n=2 Tax=Flavobacterium haoranii TaxID=683124 RepID=A0A1M6INJ8_9FLAO|nr:UDP-N-acetylmuramate dehydrogenase [Flavobacterium haoranii]